MRAIFPGTAFPSALVISSLVALLMSLLIVRGMDRLIASDIKGHAELLRRTDAALASMSPERIEAFHDRVPRTASDAEGYLILAAQLDQRFAPKLVEFQSEADRAPMWLLHRPSGESAGRWRWEILIAGVNERTCDLIDQWVKSEAGSARFEFQPEVCRDRGEARLSLPLAARA